MHLSLRSSTRALITVDIRDRAHCCFGTKGDTSLESVGRNKDDNNSCDLYLSAESFFAACVMCYGHATSLDAAVSRRGKLFLFFLTSAEGNHMGLGV